MLPLLLVFVLLVGHEGNIIKELGMMIEVNYELSGCYGDVEVHVVI